MPITISLDKVDRARLAAAIPDQRSLFDFERLFDAVIELQGMVGASDPYTAAPGDIVYSAGTTRAQALPADGALHLRADYPALFAAIGTTYGSTLSTNFRVPDITGRVIAGKEAAGGVRLTAARSGIDGGTLGAAGGLQDHTLQLTEIPSHDHGGVTSSDGAHTHVYDKPTAVASGASPNSINAGAFATTNTTSNGAHTHTITAAGGGGAHLNVQPTIVLNAFILY